MQYRAHASANRTALLSTSNGYVAAPSGLAPNGNGNGHGHGHGHGPFGLASAPGVGGASGMPPSNRYEQNVGEQARAAMEDANNRAIEELSNKTGHMLSLARDVESLLEQDKHLINNMDSSFDRVTAMMRGTVGQVQKMLETGGAKHMSMLVCFILAVFFVLYWLMSVK